MIKTVFKVLSVIMALCVFLGTMPVVSFAESIELETVENIPMIKFSPKTQIDVQVGGNTINKFYSVGTEVDTTKYFYNQLTSNQKKIYDQIWAAGPVETIDIDMTGISITGTGLTSSACQNNAVNNAQQDIIMAITALNEDKPLFFWSAGFGFTPYGTVERNGLNYICTITALTITISLDATHFTDYNDVKTKLQAVKDKYPTIPVYGISRHEKLKSINDYLANNIVYDDTIAEPNIFDVYGALITGVCVCEGYAEAFKLLCDREGIPCVTVVGTAGGPHKWNMVQMEDGEWYTLDPTWNDQDSNIFYSYFLNGGGTKAPWYNPDVADSTVHVATGTIFDGAPTALTYPTLSFDAYGIGLLAPNTGDIHFDKARGVIMVGKGITNYYQYFVDPDFYYLEDTNTFDTTRNGTGTTTSTLTVTDGTTTKTYLVAMRGDVNASNTVNSTDYTVLTKVCATTQKVDDATAKFYAGDMTQDGAIDGFDAIAHELYTSGTLVFD